MSSAAPRPFADAVLAYAQAGWPCIMPVPIDKHPPPVGFTGADGADTDPLQLTIWAGTHAANSIALRMPDGVIGIDVDQYTKGAVVKRGADTLAELEARLGGLPATWSSTARGAESPSRIRFYRVPARRYVTKFPDVEIIQRHHRYAVVWPSPHPDAGGIYRWYDPAGHASDQPPKPDELAELTTEWVAGLAEGATDQGPAAADVASGQGLLEQLLVDERPACAEIASAVMTAVADLSKTDAGSRHDTATGRVHQLVQLAAAGHPGLGRALPDLAQMWEALTAGEDRAGEWLRMLLTSARKAVTVVGPKQVGSDPCLLIGSIPVAAPAPSDDRPDADPVEPIEPARLLHPLEVIGTHLFDPRGFLDQTMAEAAHERIAPTLRYAYDARAWLLRGPDTWAMRADLAEWAVALLAKLMPHGDPAADKGSDARDQAERRKRFMSAGTSAAIAKKMRALVAGGVHPCALRITDLDREPWLLWAGGHPWDLRASTDTPTIARIDPATPHLHSAAITPDARPTPLWDAFTAAVWPDPDLRAWALRVLAVAFTGYSDKALPILIGEKDRGKTQIVALLMSVLGTYAHAADPRLLGSVDNAHASIVYALMGRRLSFIDEGPREGRLGQERLKQLTGGGELTGNQMGANPVTFQPTHTLVLTTNDEPLLTDAAVRGRARLIPCEGDPEQVITTRAAIGSPAEAAWRREAPGVLAAMMREAGHWLADRRSALTSAAPGAYRYRGEQIAAEQDPVAGWLEDEVDEDDPGERSRALYEGFRAWCRRGGLKDSQIPTETKWGREVGRRGYPPVKQRDGNYRELRIRPRDAFGVWLAPTSTSRARTEPLDERGGLTTTGGGFVEGSAANPPQNNSPGNAELQGPEMISVEGVEGSGTPHAHAHAHAHTRTRAHEAEPGNASEPSKPSATLHSAAITEKLTRSRAEPPPSEPAAPPAGAILCTRDGQAPTAGDLRAVQAFAEQAAGPALQLEHPPANPKAAAREQAQRARIAQAAGARLELPAAVTRTGPPTPITLDQVLPTLWAFGDTLTVDVETTGYPIGHPDYALRTVQLGNEHLAVVLDANDPDHTAIARTALDAATTLHAHSATADLIPLAVAGIITDLEDAWARMHDTVIPAKLADPRSTGSDPGLKQIAHAMLGDAATSPAADDARAALFKAGRWLTDIDATTARERSGWAQADPRCATMVRYAASDVLDDAAIAARLPAVTPAVLERERLAQRMTARVAHRGLRIDPDHLAELHPRHTAARTEAGQRVRAFGIDNPGSDQQIGTRLTELGATLPTTPTGRPSVARGSLDRYRDLEGTVGDLVRAVLDYRHHDTVLGTFLDPYRVLVEQGDGRARPTVYTLGTDTGRMSCVRPNLQQLPREGGVRACITADPGTVLISADFAGVELRTAAALSGDRNLRAMLADGIDVHWEIARLAFGPEATKSDRYAVKRGVFGRIYGGGIPAIARGVGVSETIAAAIIDALDAMLPELAAWSQSIRDAVKAGHTAFPAYSGRTIHLPRGYPHKAPNYCIQGTARELLIDALVRWADTPWGDAVLLPVHDELLVVVPENDATTALAALTTAMETDLNGVAIKAEASQPSFSWGDAS
jgi:P4 family phage/plasmid primase-like protien